MLMRLFAAGAIASACFAASAAAAEEDWRPAGRDSAIAACIDRNEYKPAQLSEAVEDGLGDWIVWVEDKDGDLWLCNANEGGDVYANVFLEGDLLGGEGAQLIANRDGDEEEEVGPASRAESLCAAVGAMVEDLTITVTVDDALGDYLVWLQNDAGAYWMCNASAEQELYAFEPVEYPIEEDAAAAEDECCLPFEDRNI